MQEPPNQPPETPPGGPPEQVQPCNPAEGEAPSKRRGNPANLNRGVPKNVERGPDGKLKRRVPAPVSEIKADEKVLSTEIGPKLEAMQWVVSHAPGDEQTWQQRHMREFKEKNPSAFWARLEKLQDEHDALGITKPNDSVAVWDGKGPCPCCGFEKEQPIEDEGTNKILAMLDELDGRGKVA
jgi:hypothetical protein